MRISWKQMGDDNSKDRHILIANDVTLKEAKNALDNRLKSVSLDYETVAFAHIAEGDNLYTDIDLAIFSTNTRYLGAWKEANPYDWKNFWIDAHPVICKSKEDYKELVTTCWPQFDVDDAAYEQLASKGVKAYLSADDFKDTLEIVINNMREVVE